MLRLLQILKLLAPSTNLIIKITIMIIIMIIMIMIKMYSKK